MPSPDPPTWPVFTLRRNGGSLAIRGTKENELVPQPHALTQYGGLTSSLVLALAEIHCCEVHARYFSAGSAIKIWHATEKFVARKKYVLTLPTKI
jgi:hypothetical protein